MSGDIPEAAIRVLVPIATETRGTARPGRIRLAKALSASAGAGVPGMARISGRDKQKATKAGDSGDAAKGIRLSQDDRDRLVALKQRLKPLGMDARKRQLVGAGLRLLADLGDDELIKALQAADREGADDRH